MGGWVVKREGRQPSAVDRFYSQPLGRSREVERFHSARLDAEKVAGAVAVGGAETGNHDLSSRILGQGLRPGTLNPQPHRKPDGYGIGRGAQIVDMPTQRGATS